MEIGDEFLLSENVYGREKLGMYEKLFVRFLRDNAYVTPLPVFLIRALLRTR